MSNLNSTYRKVSFLLPVVYILSFLFSPYFHHHTDEVINFNNDRFHSHLINDLLEKTSKSQDHSHSVDESSKFHFHFVKLSSAPTISTKRIVNPIPYFIEVNNLDYLEVTKKYLAKNINVKPKNLKVRERYVRSASNVSPPLV